MMVIDETDRKILASLVENPKASLRELAGRLGVSFVTVMNRTKRLEKEKIILKYTTKVDYEKLGFGTHVMIEVRVSKGKIFELERKIARSPNVEAVYDITGDSDAIVLARFISTRSMDAFLKKIQAFDFVERTNTKLILNTIKEDQIGLWHKDEEVPKNLTKTHIN